MTAIDMPMRPTLLRQSTAPSVRERVAGNVRGALAVGRFRAVHLASILGVSYPTALSRWHGRTGYRVEELVKISHACFVPIQRLIDDNQ